MRSTTTSSLPVSLLGNVSPAGPRPVGANGKLE